MLAACVTAPPTVNGSDRKPINSAETITMIKAGFSAAPPDSDKGTPRMSRVFRYHFPAFGTSLNLSAQQLADLMPVARRAESVVVRGRTDGASPSAGDLLTAKARALAAKKILIDNGIKRSKITLDYVSADDYLDDNGTIDGRAMNRRVEIEIIGQL
jgi:outer membrane protein OmpA-like peptidoglycan-associated protein